MLTCPFCFAPVSLDLGLQRYNVFLSGKMFFDFFKLFKRFQNLKSYSPSQCSSSLLSSFELGLQKYKLFLN